MIGTLRGKLVLSFAAFAALLSILPVAAEAQEQIKPRILLIFDTSGSMVWSVGPGGTMDRSNGDGSWDPWPGGTFCCPGKGNSRIYHAKQAVRQMVFATGDIEFALMKFVQEYEDGPGGTPNSYNTTRTDYLYYGNQTAGALDTIPYQAYYTCEWPPLSGTPISFDPYGSAGDIKWLCAEFPSTDEDSNGAVMMWMDHHQYSSTNLGEIDDAPVYDWSRAGDGLEQELRAIGATPIAGSLYAAEDYLTAAYGADYTADSDAAVCRPYSVILLTDGDETCGGDTSAAATALHTISHASGDKTVNIWVIGFSYQGDGDALDDIASIGGTNYARTATNSTELSGVLYDIVSDSLLVEICDGEDNDCDGYIDEGFDKYCDYGEADGCGTTTDEDFCDRPSECACDGIDNNCDGVTDELPDGATSWPVYENVCGGCDNTVEGQGYCDDPNEGRCDQGNLVCSPGTGYECVGSVDPVPETCNNLDDDCDGLIDEGIVGETCGACGDGNWTCISGQTLCCGAGSTSTTCVPITTPQIETCNAEDDDCDGQTDEDVMRGCGGCDEVDCEDPNEGVCAEGQEICTMGYWGECSSDIGPSEEICDTLDNDCDGETDEGIVGAACGACDDGNYYCIDGGEQCCSGVDGDGDCIPVQVPTAEECNGEDDDCDGLTDEELAPQDCDDDGYEDVMGVGICAVGYQICTDGVWGNVNPSTGEWQNDFCRGRQLPTDEVCDNLDNDCDGDTDEGLGGAEGCGPCGDGHEECIEGILQCTDATAPTAEVCNGVDDNCNSLTDEGMQLSCGGCRVPETASDTDTELDTDSDDGVPDEYVDCLAAQEADTDIGPGEGECQEGARFCDPEASDLWGECQGGIGPAAELCDAKDNDCDGVTDEDDEIENVNESCATAVGICEAGWWRCVDDGNGGKGLECCAEVTDDNLCVTPDGPQPEVCDGIDNDCDGSTDEELDNAGDDCGLGIGECAAGTIECVCEDENDPSSCDMVCTGNSEGTEEVCDALDNDCDGQTDEELPLGSECTNAPGGVATGECDTGYEECINGDWVCNANEPTDEICDGLDNDCDGETDENLTVECPDNSICIEGECAPACVGEELQCPPGLACVDMPSESGDTVRVCTTDVCRNGSENALPCVANPYWCSSGYKPLCKCSQALHECVSICEGVLCPNGKACVASTGQCQTIGDDCYASGCSGEQLCRGGECVDNPCAEVECDDGEYCNYDGDCVKPCVDIECSVRCFEGACVDLCDGVTCENNEVCNDITGECEEQNACDGVTCKYYQVCQGGECVEDPCYTITCPNGLYCEEGTCRSYGDTTLPDSDSGGDGDTDTDTDSADENTAGPSDTAEDTEDDQSYGMDRVLATGMGGCLCSAAPGAAPSPSSLWIAAIALIGLALRFGLRRLSFVKATLVGLWVLGMLLAVGCTTEPYVFNKPSGGDTGDTGEDSEVSTASENTDTGSDSEIDTAECDTEAADDDCDGVDDDCDGETDEGVDLQTNSQFCGSCDNDCREKYENAFGLCEAGACKMGDCSPSYHDMNESDTDGCEYYCVVRSDVDRCNGVDLEDGSYRGIDDDCDGETDEEEDLKLLTDPSNCGRCGHICRATNATPRCVDGECTFDPTEDCNEDFHDLNGIADDGCEYACEKTADEETVCDKKDDDCDGLTDEDDPQGGDACYEFSSGCTVEGDTITCPDDSRCSAGVRTCTNGVLVCDGQVGPSPTEICNGKDDNCNGEVDENLVQSCSSGGEDFQEIGVCRKGYLTCENGEYDTDNCEGEMLPGDEICDGFDNDCDGATDEDENGDPLVGDTCSQCGGRWYCIAGLKYCCLALDADGNCVEPQAPQAETCDGFDNDCDGITDNNITPELCDGDDEDSCQEGMWGCEGGNRICSDDTGDNVEVCDGLDNDCDGYIDDDDSGLTDPPEDFCNEDCGAAYEGVVCMGTAGWQCNYDCDAVQCNSFGQVVTTETLCDGEDNDCDGETDEGLLSTAENCGGCGNNCWDTAGDNVLSLVCLEGTCRVSECEEGYHNLDGDMDCEYGPCTAESDEGTVCDGVDNNCNGLTDEGLAVAEVCDGVDNDCDGDTDEFSTLPDICNTRCPSGTYSVECDGAAGWNCHYDCDALDCVEGGTAISAEAETACDGVDNNCDGVTDEGFMLWTDQSTTKGALCVSDGVGGCSQLGWVKCSEDGLSYVCCSEQSGDGCATENIIPETPEEGVENGTAADGVDNDCDGTVDDGADGCVESVSIDGPEGSFEIFAYEASKRVSAQKAPCSESQAEGTTPWTNVSFEDARDACLRLNDNEGACSYDTPDSNGSDCWDLCSAEQWYYACAYGAPSTSAPHLYPYGDAYDADACNGVEYDTEDGAIAAGGVSSCEASWNSGADSLWDMSGNVEEWTLDLRTVSSTDLRVIRGGSYKAVSNGLTCDFNFLAADELEFQMEQLGFRCCKGANPVSACQNGIDMIPSHPFTFDVPGDSSRCEGDTWWINSDKDDNWQLGKTTLSAVDTTSCVYGTTLNDSYTANRDNYFYSSPIDFSVCAGEQIDLTWNMYFDNGGDSGDYLYLRMRTSPDNGESWSSWSQMGANITSGNSEWSTVFTRTVTASVTADTLYQIQFIFHADSDGTVGNGVYLDNLRFLIN